MFQKLFGPSWKTTVSGIVVFIGGLGAVVSHTAIGPTPAGLIIESISEVFALAAGAFGLYQAKDKSVTGIGTKATTDTSKDGTVPTPKP